MPAEANDATAGTTVHRHRLQRGPTASGYRVETFRDVIVRHGGTMGGIAVICLLLPDSLSMLELTTTRLLDRPLPYVAAVAALLVFFALWSTRRPFIPERQCRWVLYLLFISIVEEVAFRLVLPSLLDGSLGWRGANILSNLLFAGLHYFTLRWKLRNCVVTFFGGMGLSHLLAGQGDLALIVLVHWFGTFLNTPFPPALRPGR